MNSGLAGESKHTNSAELHVKCTSTSCKSTYWVAAQAVPGPWQQPPAGCQEAEGPCSVRLADSPTSLVCEGETSVSLLALSGSYRFSLLINDSIHPTREKKKKITVLSVKYKQAAAELM